MVSSTESSAVALVASTAAAVVSAASPCCDATVPTTPSMVSNVRPSFEAMIESSLILFLLGSRADAFHLGHRIGAGKGPQGRQEHVILFETI